MTNTSCHRKFTTTDNRFISTSIADHSLIVKKLVLMTIVCVCPTGRLHVLKDGNCCNKFKDNTIVVSALVNINLQFPWALNNSQLRPTIPPQIFLTGLDSDKVSPAFVMVVLGNAGYRVWCPKKRATSEELELVGECDNNKARELGK